MSLIVKLFVCDIILANHGDFRAQEARPRYSPQILIRLSFTATREFNSARRSISCAGPRRFELPAAVARLNAGAAPWKAEFVDLEKLEARRGTEVCRVRTRHI